MKITQPKQAVSLALNAPASGVTVVDSGGYYGGGPLSLEDVLALIGAGTYPDVFLLRRFGGGDDTFNLGNPMGAAVTADMANASVFYGTLDQDCTISTTSWLAAGQRSTIAFEILEDGTGGWTPTFSGVTWIGGTPTWDTTAGTVTHVVLFSRDGGTTIYGAVIGGGGFDTSLVPVAASGSTETINVALGRTWDITLTADCTFSLTGAVPSEAWFVTVVRRQDGTGGWTETWPGSVVWVSGAAPVLDPTPAAVHIATMFSLDGGTTWYASEVGGVSALGDLSDVTLTTPATADRLRFDGSVWRNSALIWTPLTVYDGTNWLPLVDGSGNAIMSEV